MIQADLVIDVLMASDSGEARGACSMCNVKEARCPALRDVRCMHAGFTHVCSLGRGGGAGGKEDTSKEEVKFGKAAVR